MGMLYGSMRMFHVKHPNRRVRLGWMITWSADLRVRWPPQCYEKSFGSRSSRNERNSSSSSSADSSSMGFRTI